MKRFMDFISVLFYPLFIPTYGIILLFQGGGFAETTLSYKLFVTIITFFITAVVPISCILFLIKTKVVKSIQIENKEERKIPYIISFISFCFVIMFFWKLNWPYFIIALAVGAIVAEVVIAVINIQWKISAHMCGVGSICAAVLVVAVRTNIDCFFTIIVCILISGLVASARLYLGAHDWKQIVAGFFDGFILVLVSGLLV